MFYIKGMNRNTFIKLNMAALGALSSGQFLNSVLKKNGHPIYIFSKHLQFLDFENMARVAKIMGFDGVDLTVRPNGHVPPEKVKEELPKAAKALRKEGLSLEMITTHINSIDSPHTEELLKVAADEGVTFYRMGSIKYKPELTIPDNLDKITSQMESLAKVNEQLGIKGAYQNHSGIRFGAPIWDIYQVLSAIDSDWLGIQYDIKHATAEGGKSWEIDLELIKPYIHTMDIKDFYWNKEEDGWKEKYVPLGKGMVNYDAFFEQLAKDDLVCPLSLHFEY